MTAITDWSAADEAAHVFAYWADSLAFLRTLPADWCHAIITDPPYGLADHKPERVVEALTAWAGGDRERVPTGRGFMGREWDAFVPPPALWDECLRVLKPGGHLAVFAGSRTVDLMGLSIRLAGFEMRDGIAAWVYGSGFPKSRDVSKDLDRMAGATREVVGQKYAPQGTTKPSTLGGSGGFRWGSEHHAWEDLPEEARAYYWAAQERLQNVTAPATDAAREWQGWGTALKPAHEPILLARKPLSGTVAANVLAHRAGALNVDACRVATNEALSGGGASASGTFMLDGFSTLAELERAAARGEQTPKGRDAAATYARALRAKSERQPGAEPGVGRWPTNVVLAHHPECGPDEAPGPCVPGCQVAALDEQSGTTTSSAHTRHNSQRASGMREGGALGRAETGSPADSGGASRFYPTFRYQAKAPKSERPIVDGRGHPTVKPLGLMQWLVRLLVPVRPGHAGMVVDPFAGSGATLEAARLEGVRAVGIERDEHSARLIAKRLGVPFVGPDPDPTELLLRTVIRVEGLPSLKTLARAAVRAELWTDDVRAAFTARKTELLGEEVAA